MVKAGRSKGRIRKEEAGLVDGDLLNPLCLLPHILSVGGKGAKVSLSLSFSRGSREKSEEKCAKTCCGVRNSEAANYNAGRKQKREQILGRCFVLGLIFSGRSLLSLFASDIWSDGGFGGHLACGGGGGGGLLMWDVQRRMREIPLSPPPCCVSPALRASPTDE